MKKIIFILIYLSFSFCLYSQTRSENFEDNAINPFVIEGVPPHSITIESPSFGARSGTKVHKLVWYEQYYDGTRATRSVEGLSGSGSQNPRITSEGWFGFSFYLPSSGFPTNKSMIITQIHCWTSALSKTDKTITLSVMSDASLILKGFYGIGDGGATQTANLVLLQPGELSSNLNRWHDVIIYVKFSNNNTGILKVWMDGAPESTPTAVATNIKIGNGAWTSANVMKDGAYVKWGIYAWDVANHSVNEVRTIYFDEIAYLVGNTTGAYNAVKPGSTTVGFNPVLNYQNENIKIYPNPFTDKLNIICDSYINNIVIYNSLGESVINKNFNTNVINLNLSNLSIGNYIIKINKYNTNLINKIK